MCGIVIAVGGTAHTRRAVGLTALEHIEHRGSVGTRDEILDDPGSGVLMGTHRLPIVGRQSGRQPVRSRSGRSVLVQNGEVYNSRVLAEGLPGADGEGPDHSDSAVLVELVEHRGVEAAVRALTWEGVFACLDRESRLVYVARDHLGVKPLYLAWVDGMLVLASELKCLTGLEPDGGVHEVGPGTVLRVPVDAPHDLVTTVWWSPEEHVARHGRVREDLSAAGAVGDAVRAAVWARVPEERYAVALSGGLDSSLVLAHAVERSRDVIAFVLHRPGSEDVVAARRLCSDLGVDLVEVPGEGPDALREQAHDVVGIVESWEWHVVNHSAPMTALMRAISSSGIRVVLTGEGADELFMGYDERDGEGRRVVVADLLEKRRIDRLRSLHRTNCQRLDRMSMHQTLECRVPFLDRKVVETALAVPAARHRVGGDPKALLRAAGRRVLPAYVTERTKLSLAKGAGYVYDPAAGGGVFQAQALDRSVEADREEVEQFPHRFPVERDLVRFFVAHGYHRAGFMREPTV